MFFFCSGSSDVNTEVNEAMNKKWGNRFWQVIREKCFASAAGVSTVCFLSVLFMAKASALEAEDDKNPIDSRWQATLQEAKGQTVYFNAWGGDNRINNYILWAADAIIKQYGVDLKLVKVDDISPVVSRVLSEKAVGRTTRGSVDLIWINGENFRSMKQNQLLYGPFSSEIPAMGYIDPVEKPTTVLDFGEPVDGMEAPWGMAQLVFIYDSQRVKTPPANVQQLLAFAEKNPGRVTYPSPPDFIGTTFLKQLLSELINDPHMLTRPVDEQDFEKLSEPLWEYLDKLHPFLWRKGKSFPSSNMALTPMLDDGEIMLSMTFNPVYASAAISNGELSQTVRTYVHDKGTLGNTHFLAIPFNSSAVAGAKVVINFLLSPDAQLRKANPKVWGDPTVLSMGRLSATDKQRFQQLPLGIATLPTEKLGKALPEPHVSWVSAMEKAWQKRYR